MANGNDIIQPANDDPFNAALLAQFPELAVGVRDMAEEVFPVDALSEEELAELEALQTRATRLAPLEAPAPMRNNRIRGNPFSINTAPVNNAIQQGLVNIINAVRQRRLLGDPEKAEKLTNEAAQLREQAEGMEGDMDTIRKARKLFSRAQQLESEAEEAQGVSGRIRSLQTKQERADQNREAQMETLARLYPEVAARMTTIAGQQETERRRHNMTLEEIETEHEARMEEIQAKFGTQGGSGRGIPAQVLDILSENVDAVNQTVRDDINKLQSEESRLLRAKTDEELAKSAKAELGDKSIDQRLQEISTEIPKLRNKLETSINEMIRVSANRNNLDEASIRKLLGISDSSRPTNTPAQTDAQDTSKTITTQTMQEWADKYYDGDTQRARQKLESSGYTIQDN